MASTDSGYFSRFPIIDYNGKQTIDLTRRVRISDSMLRQPNVFYPFTLTNEMRPDTLAFDYYGDPGVEWMTYLSNGIIDPYYGWYLTDDEFGRHIEKKYGDIDDPQLRIHHWVTNWADADLNVSVNFYENQLPEALKKYWIPNYGMGAKIISYKRRPEDWYVSTNRIIKVDITDVTGPGFEVGELISFRKNVNIGFGEITQVEDDAIYVKNVVDIYDDLDSSIEGHGGTSARPVGVTTLIENIPLEEGNYWEPITVYEWENEKNEANKLITLLDVNYAPSLARNLTKMLNE